MKKILVALDGSVREQGVLDAAALFGMQTGATLVLLRSVGLPDSLPPEAYEISPNDVMATLQSQAKEALDRLAFTLPTALAATLRVVAGTPWQSVERVAVEENVDLIVIGSHGYDVLDHILGTTAAKVVNHATCSVLVVREPERFTS